MTSFAVVNAVRLWHIAREIVRSIVIPAVHMETGLFAENTFAEFTYAECTYARFTLA